MMGWMYMLVCTMDFVGFPVLWSLLQAYDHGQVTSQWQPLTLQGAGLFHLAMGAVIGISAYGRTQEKLNGAETGGLGSFGPGVGTTYVPPTANVNENINVGNQTPASGGFGASTSSGFGASTGGFGASTGGFGATTTPAPTINVTNVTVDTPAAPFPTLSSSAPPAAPVTGQVTTGFGGKHKPIPASSPAI
jgi:hypothetical protein